MTTPVSNTNAARPAWAETLRQKYLAGEASIFILHGNVHDQVLVGDQRLVLGDFLAQHLLANKEAVLELGWARGLRQIGGTGLLDDKNTAEGRVREARLTFNPQDLVSGGVSAAFQRVETQALRKDAKVALVIPYAGTLLPSTDPAFLSTDERAAFTTVHRWSIDPALAVNDFVVILVCESPAEINPALLGSPRVAQVEIPLPDLAERERVVRAAAGGMDEETIDLLAAHTSGLRAIQIETIVSSQGGVSLDEDARRSLVAKLLAGQPDADERAAKLATITAGQTEEEIRKLVGAVKAPDVSVRDALMRVIHARKRELIEKECGGLISFMDSKHGLDAVGGCEDIKGELMDIAKLLKSGNRALSPMGLLAVGAMGSGKTFVIRAFLKEAGLTGVTLKNIRSKWVGSTESNLERVLATIKAMGPIAVVIDESDRSFGGKDQADTDGGVSSRVMARLKEFMSDTDNRGQVLFILMTNRPDRIETDLKRPGRLDRKIPFFYAETDAERKDVLQAILRRGTVALGTEPEVAAAVDAACAAMAGYSNADIEAVALLAQEFAAREGTTISAVTLARAVEDFIPPRETDMIRLMDLLAAQETSRRSLLPERFRTLTNAQIADEVSLLRRKVRED